MNRSTCRRRRPAVLTCLALFAALGAALFAAPPPAPDPSLPFALEIRGRGGKAVTLHHAADWAPSSRRFRDVVELVGPAEPEVAGKRVPPPRMLVGSELFPSAEEAVARLRRLASQFPDAEIEYLEIAGWPALYTSRERPYDRIGAGRGTKARYGSVLVSSVAIAAGDTVVRLRAEIPSKSQAVVAQVRAMARALELERRGDPEATARWLETLRAQPRAQATPREQPTLEEMLASEPAGSGSAESSGLVRNAGPNSFSEIEVAVSTSGQHVVVASNGRNYATSNDGGQTYSEDWVFSPCDSAASNDIGYCANGDPSVGFGQSGDFYLGFIAFPDGDSTTGGGDDVDGCTTGLTRSTTNGTNFTHRGHAAWCQRDGPTCFPDQEHIAVDRWNPSASGQDQLYNTWRNFTNGTDDDCDDIGGGTPQALLTCSVDGGQTWNNGGPASISTTGSDPQGTAPVVVGFGDGDFPRITVGQDGFVYVVYMVGNDIEIDKFTSCANGLAYVWAAPELVVGSISAVDCPMPGLDRCNDGNDLRSPTVTVDDLDASHLFVSFAENTSASNENVYVVDSTNGGEDWSAAVRVNSGFSARRFMPWTCAVCGEAFVGFYDRRSSTVSDNSLTDFYLGRVRRDPVGGLLAGTELRVSPTADSQCGPPNDPDLWCTPRSANDSEGCTQQPQLAGACVDAADADMDGNPDNLSQRCDYSDCGGANANINFGANPGCQCAGVDTGSGQVQCVTGGGCPKYGDYSGIACQAGRVYAAYASATPPGGPQNADGSIDTFTLVQLVGCAAQIQVPGSVDIGLVCGDVDGKGTLHVCNTGKADLEVDSISSSDPQFAVTTPSSGYPVVISPDFCFPFEVVFDAASDASGTQSALLTVVSNDPLNPSVTVTATAAVGEPDINVPHSTSTVDFGNVCAGSTAQMEIPVCNTGNCNLEVASAAIDCDDFTIVADPFPAAVSPDFCIPLVVAYTPTEDGPHQCTLTITSDDPDENPVTVTLSATTPATVIDVPPDLAFAPEVVSSVDACSSSKPFPISNNGLCPLTITDVSILTNDDEYGLSGLPSFPIPIAPGHQLGEGDLDVLFAPDEPLDRDKLGTIRVTYVSDPVSGATNFVDRSLCGEGTLTGARVLVTRGGAPVDVVDRIHLTRVVGNRNRKPQLQSVSVTMDASLVNFIPAPPCEPFSYHQEWGTVGNPVQLPPGVYQLTATIRVDGKKASKTVAFSVDACDFNPSVVVTF